MDAYTTITLAAPFPTEQTPVEYEHGGGTTTVPHVHYRLSGRYLLMVKAPVNTCSPVSPVTAHDIGVHYLSRY